MKEQILTSAELSEMAKSLSLDIQQTRELMSFLADLANLIDASLEDGRVTYFELLGFMGLIPGIRPAIEGIKQVPAELADLSEEERFVLVETVRQRLRLRNPITTELAQKAINLALHFTEFIAEVRNVRELQAAELV